MGKGRCHAAVHILRIRQTTEGSGLPFRRFDAPGGIESQLVFAATLSQLPTCKMQIAAEIVDFCESAIVAERECQRLSLRQAGEGIVRPCNQAIGRGATEESAAPVTVFAGDCQSLDVSFESLGPASCIQLKSAHEHSKFECMTWLGRDQLAACSKGYRVVLAEQVRLGFSRCKIGARCFGIAGTVEMLGSQYRIIEKDRRCSTMQLSLPSVRKRTVHAVAYQRMSELQTIPRWTYQDVPHQSVAIVLRLLEQRPEVRKAEALAEHGGRLDGAAVLGR